jgi:hypothetical protein
VRPLLSEGAAGAEVRGAGGRSWRRRASRRPAVASGGPAEVGWLGGEQQADAAAAAPPPQRGASVQHGARKARQGKSWI